MWNHFSDIAPKAVVAAVTVWGAANYLLIAPEVAARIARADYMPECHANFRTLALKSAEEKAQALPPPVLDATREMAASQLRAIANNPMMQELNNAGLGQMFGMSQTFDLSLQQYEQEKQAAIDAYKNSIEQIKEDTATTLGKAGDVCGAVADTAIAETRTDWSIFSATLGLVKPVGVQTFGERMRQVYEAGRYNGGKAGS